MGRRGAEGDGFLAILPSADPGSRGCGLEGAWVPPTAALPPTDGEKLSGVTDGGRPHCAGHAEGRGLQREPPRAGGEQGRGEQHSRVYEIRGHRVPQAVGRQYGCSCPGLGGVQVLHTG